MLTTSRTCWMSLLSLYFLRSLLANLERVLPQHGIDTDLAAWGNILNPCFQVNLQFKKKNCKLFFVQKILLRESSTHEDKDLYVTESGNNNR